ncbi:MAG: molybdenum cofactor guanylyltransferase [Vicingaceae bacterium]|nr:molybdenum cofactor guanylyltransferase [Vicingaceae bacterium]
MTLAKNKITVILLAGGKSSRMGADKGLLLINEKPMIQHIIDAVRVISNNIIIVSNQMEYTQFGFPVFEDRIKESGPLAGIYTGLVHSKTHQNIVLSCDVPYVSAALITFLMEQSSNFDVTIPQKKDRLHPLIGVYTQACLPVFKNELKHQQLKVKLAIEKMKLNIVDAALFADFNFMNINTPIDIKNTTT